MVDNSAGEERDYLAKELPGGGVFSGTSLGFLLLFFFQCLGEAVSDHVQ